MVLTRICLTPFRIFDVKSAAHSSLTLSFEDKSSLVTSPFGSPRTPTLIRSGVLATALKAGVLNEKRFRL